MPGRYMLLGILAVPDWIFGRRAAGLDLGAGIVAATWCTIMISRPELFDQGVYVGLNWLPDEWWIALFASLTAMHFLGLVRPRWLFLRISCLLLAGWAWIFVAVSYWRVDLVPGVSAYGVIGAGCVFGAIHLASLPRTVR